MVPVILFFTTLWQVSPNKCSVDEIELTAKNFFESGGFDSSRCPAPKWIDTLAKDTSCEYRTKRKLNILVVGGNKGFDCLGWARLFSKDYNQFNSTSWYLKQQELDPNLSCGACKQCKKSSVYPTAVIKPISTHVYCVEPGRKNLEILHHAVHGLGLAHTITIIDAAVNLHIGKNETVQFPNTHKYGKESHRIVEDDKNTEQRTNSTIPVRATTIDRLYKVDLSHHAPEVLTIDTEGFDALALLSSAKLLSTGRVGYIEFEYHNVGPWANYKLEYVIDFLDNLNYECFWATNTGVLYKITGCYHKKYDEHQWSNVVCVHKEHSCWYRAILKHVYKPFL